MRNLSVLALLAFAALTACTGSPATLAAQPAFEATTPFGLASVSIRETPFGMPWAEFEQAVRDGTEAEVRLQPAPAVPPFPARRIVWHVNLGMRGESRLVVNIFDGSVPFAYEQDEISSDESPEMIAGTVRSLTRRLIAAVDQRNQLAQATDRPSF